MSKWTCRACAEQCDVEIGAQILAAIANRSSALSPSQLEEMDPEEIEEWERVNAPIVCTRCGTQKGTDQ